MKIPGKPLAPVAKPPNLGIFGYAFEVDNLDKTLNVSEKAGYPIISGPVELNTPLCGKNRAAFVSAPYGTWVQLFQR
jgi:hypothetical protein